MCVCLCVRAAARVSSVLGKLSSPFTSAHVEAFWWLQERTGGQMAADSLRTQPRERERGEEELEDKWRRGRDRDELAVFHHSH